MADEDESLVGTQETAGDETPDDTLNIASHYSSEQLTNIGNMVKEEYDADIQSRTGWDERRANWLKLFSGQMDKKTEPWENCSNTSVPWLTMACLQFQARAYEALLGTGREVMQCLSLDGKAKDQATRISRYMNWDLLYNMDEWEEETDLLLLMLPLNGSAYKKAWYNPVKMRNECRTLGVDELVTPYGYRRLEEVPRLTHWFRMNLPDITDRINRGVFLKDTGIPLVGNSFNWTTGTPAYLAQADKTNSQSENPEHTRARTLLEQHRYIAPPNGGDEGPAIVTIDYEESKVLRIVSRKYDDPIMKRTEIMDFFTGFTFIPNPDSHYGFGFGHFLEHLNKTGITILNQIVDAGTLANLQGGLINKRSGVKRGSLSFYPGQFKEVDTPVDDINKAIYTFQFKPPSTVLFSVLGLLQDYVTGVTTVSESMAGQLPPSGTKATSVLALLEQGLKVFSAIHKRTHRSTKKELRKYFLLNRANLDNKRYFYVQDSEGEEIRTMEIYQNDFGTLEPNGKKDFMNLMDVIPVSDPNITSRSEKLIRAQQSYEFVMQNPLTAKDGEILYQATKDYLQALESPLYQKVKKPQPQEPPDLSPVEENAMFLKEQYPQPLPKQDHMNHLVVHESFPDTAFGQQMTAQGRKLHEQHVKEHLALAYMAQEQQQQGGGMNA